MGRTVVSFRPSRTLELPLGGLENLHLALYSPLSYPLSDFTVTLSLPEGLRLLELDSLPRENGVCNVKPLKVKRDANSYEIIYPDGSACPDKTLSTYLPIKIETSSAPGQSIKYHRSANGNFTELPQEIPIKALPEINGAMPRRILIQQYVLSPAKTSKLSAEHLREYVRQNLAAGFNSIIVDPKQTSGGSAMQELYREYLAQCPGIKIFLNQSMGFPMNLKLWGGVEPCVSGMIDWGNAHPEAKPRYFNDQPPASELWKEWKEGDSGVPYGVLCPTYITGTGRTAYKKALENIMRKVFAAYSEAAGLWIDWEQPVWGPTQMGLWCFCDKCKMAFRERLKIPEAEKLNDQRIKDKYSKEWEDFRASLEGEHFRIIWEVCHELNKTLQVYAWEGHESFWRAARNNIDLPFGTVPGNSVADGFRQKSIDKAMADLRKWNNASGLIGQRFPQLPENMSTAKNGWKDSQVCSADGFSFDTKNWKTQLLRIVAGTHYGVDLCNAMLFPAGAQYHIGEATRTISQFEDLFHDGERADQLASSDALKYPDLLVLRKGDERLVLTFNGGDKPLEAAIRNLELQPGQKAEVVDGAKGLDPAEVKIAIPPQDVVLIHIK